MKLLGILLRSTVMLLLAVVIFGTFTIAQLDHNEENSLVKNAQAFFKAGDDESTWSSITKFARTTSENSKYLNKLTEYFDEDVLAVTIKNVDDYDDAAVGTNKVLQNYKTLDDFAPELKTCADNCNVVAVKAAEKIKAIGGSYDDIVAKYGEDVAKITLKGIKENVIDPKNAELPEKLAQYAKGLGKDPTDAVLGEEQLLKMFTSPGKVTKIGSENINNAVILKKGFYDSAKDVGFGSTKIIEKHTPDFVKLLGISDPDEIIDVVKEVAETGKKVVSNEPQNMVLERTVTRGARTAKVRMAINIADNEGSIVTTFPFEKII